MNLTGVLQQRALETSAAFVEGHLTKSELFSTKEQLHAFVTRHLFPGCPSGLFLEFGVFQGATLSTWAAHVPDGATEGTVFGFDAFHGLRDGWSQIDLGRGAFSTGGAVPSVQGATIIDGWVEDTLPPFLERYASDPVAFVHLDLDVYPPTAFALGLLAPRLVSGSVVVFDELVGYPGWQSHEFRALTETLDPSRYEFLAFSQEQAALRIL